MNYLPSFNFVGQNRINGSFLLTPPPRFRLLEERASSRWTWISPSLTKKNNRGRGNPPTSPPPPPPSILTPSHTNALSVQLQVEKASSRRIPQPIGEMKLRRRLRKDGVVHKVRESKDNPGKIGRRRPSPLGKKKRLVVGIITYVMCICISGISEAVAIIPDPFSAHFFC